MASIQKVPGGWLARVRRKGHHEHSRVFDTKILAEKWGRGVEQAIDQGRAGVFLPAPDLFGDVIDRYTIEIGKAKPFGKNKESVLRLIKRDLGAVPIGMLTPERLVAYIVDDRKISGVTAGIDLTYLKGVLKVARALWKINVVPSVVDDAREILKHMGLADRSNVTGAPQRTSWLP
jgi:hypothetical protein